MEFHNELSGKLKQKYGDDVANEYMAIYHNLNGTPFKNLAWLKEFDFVKRRMEDSTEAERHRNLEAIVAGLELFKDLRAYGKVYNHYKAELETPSVVKAVLPDAVASATAPKLVVSEHPKNEVIKPEPALEIKPVKRTRKVKREIKTELPAVVEDICGAKVPVELPKGAKTVSKKKTSQLVAQSSEVQSQSLLTKPVSGKRSIVVSVKPGMSDEEKEAVLTRVRNHLNSM